MKRFLLAAGLTVLVVSSAAAASLSRTYSYFTIGGTTLEEIENELRRRGPTVGDSGSRHPGATRMEFKTRVTYGEQNGRCSVVEANVSLKANMILPRWNRRGRSDEDTRLIWDTLARDIKRHEESHVVIAKNHARALEQAIRDMRRQSSCTEAAEKVKQITERVLAEHDREQAEFDRIENINFESRLLRLLKYRLQQMEAGR